MNGAPMVGMNANAGGPVGGPQMAQMPLQQDQNLIQLHTYIYDHLINMRQYDLARKFIEVCEINKRANDGQQNGDDTDSKKKNGKPSDLPEANVPERVGNSSFLQEWWATFWDFYSAAHRRSHNSNVTNFFNQNTVCPPRCRMRHCHPMLTQCQLHTKQRYTNQTHLLEGAAAMRAGVQGQLPNGLKNPMMQRNLYALMPVWN
jgi:hypothetical protein